MTNPWLDELRDGIVAASESFLYDVIGWLDDVEIGLDTDFWCDPEKGDFIAVSIFSTESMERTFAEFMYNIGLDMDYHYFAMSFLHEVGHLVTWPSLTLFDKVLDSIQRPHITDPITYYNWYIEKMASEWAVNFANDHKEEVEKFSQKIAEISKKVLDNVLTA